MKLLLQGSAQVRRRVANVPEKIKSQTCNFFFKGRRKYGDGGTRLHWVDSEAAQALYEWDVLDGVTLNWLVRSRIVAIADLAFWVGALEGRAAAAV